MELENHPNIKFMPQFTRHEPLVKDHSAFKLFKECPRKYFYRIILGFDTNETKPWFAYGSAYHKFREILELEYKKFVEEGKSKEDAILFSFQPALASALKLFDKNPPQVQAGSKYDYYTRDRLIKSCTEAWKHVTLEKKQGKIEVISVEQYFTFALPDGSFRCGKWDQLVRWNGQLWGRDFKTTSKEQAYYSRTLDPNHQFSLYTYGESKLTGSRVQGQMVEVLYNSKSKGPLIWPMIAARSQAQLEEWERESLLNNKLLNMCREEDTWPKLEDYGCTFCDYHSVCSKATEAGQAAHLKAKFVKRIWDPSQIHEE